MRITKKLLALLLALCSVLSFAACSDSSATDDILDRVGTAIGTSKDDDANPSEADPEPKEGQSRMPVITFLYNSGVETLTIAGTCEEDATVTAYITGGDRVTVHADGKRFALEINLGEREEPNIHITATAPGLTESDEKIVTGSVDANNRGNKQFPTILADNFVLFSQSSIDALDEENVRTNSTIDSFMHNGTTGMEAFLKNLGKAGDTELIFVLSPSRARVLAEYLPDDVEIDSVSLYDQVKQALIECGVTVIDLRAVFGVEAEGVTPVEGNDEYPLFYKTHSGWSDYAAYLAYTEVMNYISEAFPDAAPRALEEFTKNEVENALLGDLAYYFNLNKENALNYDPNSDDYFTETYYDFILEGMLDIGNNYVFEEEASDESSEETSEDNSSEEASDAESAESSEAESSEEVSEETSEDDSSAAEEREKFLNSLITISDVGLYLDIADNDYRFYNEYFTSKETYVDPNVVLSDSAFGFYTNRSELPSAHIYRSEYCTPIIDMLAERFNNCYFSAAGDFNIKYNAATAYAGTEGNTNVDYIIVFITEEELIDLF